MTTDTRSDTRSTAPPETGLRARKKQQTREAISDAATRLFLEHGFDKVTIAEVARAAEVAKMTVTNYFPRKEDLALDLHEEYTAGPARTVAERKPGESALAALRRAHLAAVRRRDPMIGFAPLPFAQMVASSPVLTARNRELHELQERQLAETLRSETGSAPEDITPHAVATQLCGALRLLFQETLRRVLDGQDADTVATAAGRDTRKAFGLLEPALGGYAVRAGGG
jgi:AcrR family transcriptional regulator